MKYILVLLLLFTITLNAERGLKLKEMQTEQRVALVIGNNVYNHKRLSSLQNPVNDARAMKKALEQIGFSVHYGENLSVRDMNKKMSKFSKVLRSGGVGLFFFAGHGIESSGHNYLMGKDSNIDDKEDVSYESLELQKVLDKMQNSGNRLNIVLLDACRNDPFSRGGDGGLAKSTARGTFIAYATSPRDVANDGKGKNGVFTAEILKNINKAGVPIERMFKNVKVGVLNSTNERQRPWTNSDITGDFFFTLPKNGTSESRINSSKKPKSSSSFSFQNEKPTDFTLTINPSPSDATVSITNIKPKYYDGMRLKKGTYNIKVSKSGYITKRGVVTLDSDAKLTISLDKKVKQTSYKASTSLVQKSLKKIWKDKATGLIWQVKVSKKTNDFNKAKSYCKDLILGGHNNWDLPSKDELKSIITKEYYTNSKSKTGKTYIKKPLLESMNMKVPYFWNLNSVMKYTKAWENGFLYGKDSGYYTNKRISGYVRCVVGK